MHLKFRRLLSETLERRQLFSADLGYQFDSFNSDPWESDFGAAHFQQFMLVRGIKSGDPATELKRDSSNNPEFKYSSSDRDSNEVSSTPRGPRGRMSGESESSPVSAIAPSFNLSIMSPNSQAGKNNSNLGGTTSGQSSLGQSSAGARVEITLVSVSNISRPSIGNSTSSPIPVSPVHPNSTPLTLPSANSGSTDFKSVPRGSVGSVDGPSRNLFGYFDTTSTSQNNQLARTSLQSSSTVTLGQATRLSLSGITSKLDQASVSASVDRYHQTSTDSALIDITGLADNLLSNRLNAATGRSWKLEEQSIKNLKSLSRTNSEIENTAANSSDSVMANWMENTNGLIDVACRRDPIARIARPADAIEVSARLESKVGLYQVFDVIDDRDHQRNSHASQDSVNSKEIVALDTIDWGDSANLQQAPVIKNEVDSQSPEDSSDTSFRKPFFITSVLAVVGGHLLRSRRKQSALKPK